MRNSINGWMLGTDIYDKHKYKPIRQKKSSFRVYLCLSCNRVHENTYFNGEGNTVVYHDHFPTYKLERQSCGLCNQ